MAIKYPRPYLEQKDSFNTLTVGAKDDGSVRITVASGGSIYGYGQMELSLEQFLELREYLNLIHLK